MPWAWAAEPSNFAFHDALQHHNPSHDVTADFIRHDWTLHGGTTFRYGEALHPGPDVPDLEDHAFSSASTALGLLRIGCANPGGLRNKEHTVAGLGPGVWSLSETHLTAAGQRSSSTRLRHFGTMLNRQLRVHHGAPAPFRFHDGDAGSWTGVSIISDFPSQSLALPWPPDMYSTGRLLATRHIVNDVPIQVATIYGYASGPTWSQSRALTDQMLAFYTKQFVIGGSGPRLIVGDFNKEPHQLQELSIWQNLGWVEAQEYAANSWGQQIHNTCKHASRIDHIWMSPEAAMMCSAVGIQEVFADHATLHVDLNVTSSNKWISMWPRPSKIAWEDIDYDLWQQKLESSTTPSFDGGSATQFFADWTKHWEDALHGCHRRAPNGSIPNQWKGRAQRTKAVTVPVSPPVSKPSREGEVRLHCDLVTIAVQRWFKQLRRLQSFRHAALAAKSTVDAEAYRLNLWNSIKMSSGFKDGFPAWWLQRTFKDPSSPVILPLGPPDGPTAEIIFLDFRRNFQHFERWELRQRNKVIVAKYEKNMQQAFRDLRPPQRQQLDLLWHTLDFSVLAIDISTHSIHVDREVPLDCACTWQINGQQIQLQHHEGEVLTFASLPDGIEPGDSLQAFCHFADVNQIHAALIKLWQPRWNQASQLDSSDWSRIVNFIEALMPRMKVELPSFTHDRWQQTLQLFPPRPARGVDGIDVADLKQLPPSVTTPLLSFLEILDGSRVEWPQQLLTGIVLSLGKCDNAHTPNQFRPVVILGTVYRTWSRMNALPLMRHFSKLIPAAAHGFLPGRECAQVWLQLQGLIELCHQQNIEMSGFSTDLEKCFNCIARDPLMRLAQHLGFPQRLLQAWRSFLDSFSRSFQVRI